MAAPRPSSSGAKVYGTINEAAEQLVGVTTERGSILLQGWFYLGLAGLLGALAGWALAEPGFVDGSSAHWGNFVMIPIIITLMCIGVRSCRERGGALRRKKLCCAACSPCHWESCSASSST